jgi:hypothetical protein
LGDVVVFGPKRCLGEQEQQKKDDGPDFHIVPWALGINNREFWGMGGGFGQMVVVHLLRHLFHLKVSLSCTN